MSKDLIQAIAKNAKKDFGTEEKRRAEICAGCDKMKDAFYSDFFNAIIKEVKGKVCTNCSGVPCPISNKIFAKEEENICDKWKQ